MPTLVCVTPAEQVYEKKGGKCPRCGSTNTVEENGIRLCYECHKEW